MADRLTTSKSRRHVLTVLREIPSAISGENPGRVVRRYFYSHIAQELFRQIHEAFVTKSEGGIDNLNQSWPDIQAKTKAYSRPAGPTDLSTTDFLRKQEKTKGLLSAAQDTLWKKTFLRVLKGLLGRVPEDQAKAIAAAVAWKEVKAAGGQTKIDTLGKRKLPINRRSGRLQDSFLPGEIQGGTYVPPGKDQVFRAERGRLTIGSRVPYAGPVHQQRPFWPNRIDLWLETALEEGRDGIIDALRTVLQ